MDNFHCNNPYSRLLHFPLDYVFTRLSIFLISGVCVGFPAIVWASSVLRHRYKSEVGISYIAIYLLLSDLVELILSPVYLIYLFKQDSRSCSVSHLLFGARLCGHYLHLLVALESILTQKYPSLTNIFSPICSIIICTIVWMVGIGCQFTLISFKYQMNIFLCALPLVLCAITCLVTFKASPETNQATDRKSRVLVLGVAMFTLIILYLPFFLNFFIEVPFMLDSLVSMRLFSEPLLCVL